MTPVLVIFILSLIPITAIVSKTFLKHKEMELLKGNFTDDNNYKTEISLLTEEELKVLVDSIKKLKEENDQLKAEVKEIRETLYSLEQAKHNNGP